MESVFIKVANQRCLGLLKTSYSVQPFMVSFQSISSALIMYQTSCSDQAVLENLVFAILQRLKATSLIFVTLAECSQWKPPPPHVRENQVSKKQHPFLFDFPILTLPLLKSYTPLVNQNVSERLLLSYHIKMYFILLLFLADDQTKAYVTFSGYLLFYAKNVTVYLMLSSFNVK